MSKHSATLFFFHGTGRSGEEQKQVIDTLNKGELKFPHIKIVYPSAPVQLYIPSTEKFNKVWYNRYEVAIDVPEIKDSIDAMCEEASKLIDQEVASGIPYNRIIIGGFSMGGAFAIHLAYRFKKSVAACLALSSFLNYNSSVYKAVQADNGKDFPPLLQFHGSTDELIPFNWGKETNVALKNLGIETDFVSLENTGHELNEAEIEIFSEWITRIVPEKA